MEQGLLATSRSRDKILQCLCVNKCLYSSASELLELTAGASPWHFTLDRFMRQVEEDQAEWITGPYDDDVDLDEEGAYGVEAMCRLVAALHAKATMPIILQLVPEVRVARGARL